MHIYKKSLYITRTILDVILIIVVFHVSVISSLHSLNYMKETNPQLLLLLLLFLLLIWLFSTRITGLNDEFRSRNYSFELLIVIKNIAIQVISAIIILFLLKEYDLSRYFVLIYASLLFVILSLSKYLIRQLLIYYRKRGRNLRNLVIIGAGEVGQYFYNLTLSNPHFGYQVIGFLDDNKKPYLNGQYLGKIDHLDSILNTRKIDDVIVALPNYANNRIEDVIRTCENHTTRIRIIPDYFKFASGKYNVSMFGSLPIISVRDDRINELHWRISKRLFDVTFTILLYLFIFSWLMPLIILLIKKSSPGPVIFKQERWGKNNNKFSAYKFRSMRMGCGDTDASGKFKQATKDDPRVTKIGKILRKTSLDELPQFWNVLKGEMSIVGPRPHPIPLNLESKDKIHLYMLRHLVKPGITGWAQVNGYRGNTSDDALMQKRIDYDIWYIENWSFLLDIQIIILTIWKVVKGDPNAY
jgi:putative colanic acid biosynthesis UDP-glucose lipid carrier transferase